MRNWKVESFGLAGITIILMLASLLALREHHMGQLDWVAGLFFGALLFIGVGSCVILLMVRKASSARDIANRRLINSKRRYQALVESAHSGIWMLDNAGHCVFANRSLGDMLGVKPADLLDRTVFAYLGENPSALLLPLLSGNSTITCDLCYRGAFGQLGWAMVSSRIVTDELDNPTGTLLMLTDITARKQAELALAAVQVDLETRIRMRTADLQKVNDKLRSEITVREAAERALLASERRMHEIISMMPIAMFIKDADLNIVLLNDACAEQWGVTLEQVAGTRSHQVYPPEQMRIFNDHDRAVFASGKCEMREVTLWHHGRGEDRLLETYKKPVYDARGEPLYLICMTFDITERKRNEKALADSLDQLRQLTAHLETVKDEERQRIAREIHDDLGQNLLALKIDVAMLHARTGRHPRLNSRAAGMLATIDATIRSVRSIINDLHPSTLDLGLAAAVEWLVGEVVRRSGIDCTLQVRGDDHGDLDPRRRAAVFRIVQESLTNVMRHSAAAHADVRLDIGGEQVHVEIADDGVGMDPRSTAGKFGLRGMHERVGALGGELKIDSHPGGGTRLKMLLPTREEKRELETIGEK
jgi:PAS domain S-box-containing protein